MYVCWCFRITGKVGSGHFGNVEKGIWKDSTNKAVVVAVKSLASEENKVKFLQEAAIMGQFSHPNIVNLYGVVTSGVPVSSDVMFPLLLVTWEYACTSDSLLSYRSCWYLSLSLRETSKRIWQQLDQGELQHWFFGILTNKSVVTKCVSIAVLDNLWQQKQPICSSASHSKLLLECTTSPAKGLFTGTWLQETSWSQRIIFARYS